MRLLSSIAHRLNKRARAVRRMASRPRRADLDVGRLVEITFDLMSVASLDGTMLRINPGIERVLGLAPEEVVGRRLFDIVHPDDREGTVAAFAGVLAVVVLVFGVAQLPALIVTLPVIGWIWASGEYNTGPAVAYTVLLFVGGMADNVLKPLMLGRGVGAATASAAR